MPGGRRLQRTLRSTAPTPVVTLLPGDITSNRYAPLGATVPMLPGLEQPSAPKHFPFPNTPVDDDLLFELFMFCFTTIASCLQFLHLYRSVWWLPNSYTNQTMKFYLIDAHLVMFIVIILVRRLLYLAGCRLLNRCISEKLHDVAHMIYRLCLFSLMLGFLSPFTLIVFQNNHYVNIFFLCYPIFVYLILFGFTITPFFDFVTCDAGASVPLHACTSKASEIRQEAENLKSNFNMRVKRILFNSVLNAYYAGFIPCCFAQNFIYYDLYWVTQYAIFIFISCFTAYSVHILNLRYCDVLHRSALHLGCWDKIESRSVLPVAYNWQEDTLWSCGALVRYGRETYRAVGESNAAEPGTAAYGRFYKFFKNPSVPLGIVLGFQFLVVSFQFGILIRSIYWHNIISLTFVMFFNYYTIFKLGRDYLVSSQIYKAEQNMHNNKVTLH